VKKHDLRVATYGTVDEANAAIGVARLQCPDDADVDVMLSRIQNDLFDLGADLCTPIVADEAPGKALRIVQAQVDRLEREIDVMNAALAPLSSFVLPGGAPAAAALHVARTIIRRAERDITALIQSEAVNPQALMYTNRLSDHLFVLSRHINAKGAGDVLWVPGANRG
jgi:cob(I)alamin adenosyltransferase